MLQNVKSAYNVLIQKGASLIVHPATVEDEPHQELGLLVGLEGGRDDGVLPGGQADAQAHLSCAGERTARKVGYSASHFMYFCEKIRYLVLATRPPYLLPYLTLFSMSSGFPLAT